MDEEKIRREAKAILDKFAKELESVELKDKKEKREVGGTREEGKGGEEVSDFRKRMFENAPSKEGDFIVAEKKKW